MEELFSFLSLLLGDGVILLDCYATSNTGELDTAEKMRVKPEVKILLYQDVVVVDIF